jgi:RNA polymerase sigma-70 factor (ECF subfamily)
MTAEGSRKRGSGACSNVEARSNDGRQQRGYAALCASGEAAESTIHDIHDRMVKMLPRLRRFVGSLTGGADSSEDLIQETYARALAHLDQWQPGTRLDSWMFRIAQNLWIDHLRTQRTRGEVVDIEVIGDLLSCDGRVIAENRIMLRELRKDIAQLSPDQRSVISLVWGYGLSYKETGKILNLPAGTVMSRLARARDALQKHL